MPLVILQTRTDSDVGRGRDRDRERQGHDKGRRRHDVHAGAQAAQDAGASSKDETRRALTLLKGVEFLAGADQDCCHLASGVLPSALRP